METLVAVALVKEIHGMGPESVQPRPTSAHSHFEFVAENVMCQFFTDSPSAIWTVPPEPKARVNCPFSRLFLASAAVLLSPGLRVGGPPLLPPCDAVKFTALPEPPGSAAVTVSRASSV